jgi:hypothetical protein
MRARKTTLSKRKEIPMKYRVEGGTAEFGTDMVLQLTPKQVEPRAHVLEKADGGWRPTAVVQFKAGEEIGVDCVPAALPGKLGTVLVPAGSKETVAARRPTRKRPAAKKSTGGSGK